MKIQIIRRWKSSLIMALIFLSIFLTVQLFSSTLNAVDRNDTDNDDGHHIEEMGTSISVRQRIVEDNESGYELYDEDELPITRGQLFTSEDAPILKFGTRNNDAKRITTIFSDTSPVVDAAGPGENEPELKHPSAVRLDRREESTTQLLEPDAEASNQNEEDLIRSKLAAKFQKKTSQMRQTLRLQLGHDPLPVQLFTCKRLLSKLLRVPGSESDKAHKIITEMVIDGMASYGNITDKKLAEIRILVEMKLNDLTELLKHRDDRKSDQGTLTSALKSTTTTTTTTKSTDEKVKKTSDITISANDDTQLSHFDEGIVSKDIITDNKQNISVIDLDSDDDYSDLLGGEIEQFELKCRDRLTGIEYRRYMVKLADYHMVGFINDYTSDYVVLSVGLVSEMSKRYVLMLPLTVLANKRVGFGTIVILTNTMENYINNLALRHVLSRVCQLGAVVIFFPAKQINTVLISQFSRIFAADILLNICDELTRKGLKVTRPHDKYLVSSDSDMWPLKRSMFCLPKNANILSRPALSGRMIEEDGRLYRMYPLSGIGMMTKTWHNLLTKYGGVPEGMKVTADFIVQLLFDRYGQMVNRTARRSGIDETWFLDQRFLSVSIQRYLHDNKGKGVFILENSSVKNRIDKKSWPTPEQITQEMVDTFNEVHVIPVNNATVWDQVTPLLEKMYGLHSLEYSWCLDYYKEYTERSNLIKIENIIWK